MELVPFLLVSAVVIVAPGPDMALVGRNAWFGGRRAAVYTAVGVTLGLTVWSVAAGDVLRRPRLRRVVESITGAVLIAFGARLATEHR